MFLSAKAYFKNELPSYKRKLVKADTDFPQDYIAQYKKNVTPITPMASGALRRSIITLPGKGVAKISWRSDYAGAQNAGGHVVPYRVRGRRRNNDGTDTGMFGIIPADYYAYSNGAKGFAGTAYRKTNRQIPAMMRARGVIK